MTKRFEYKLDLNKLNPVVSTADEIVWRNPSHADRQPLADLMLDAYRGTIDYDGETIEDALNEVQSYFSGLADSTWLESSWLGFTNNELVCACLVSYWSDRSAPLIAYVMTGARSKGKQLASLAVSHSLQSLVERNHTEARAVITEGNIPSEKIFAKLGFTRLVSD